MNVMEPFYGIFIMISEDNVNSAHSPDETNPALYIQTQEEKLKIIDSEVSFKITNQNT